METDTILESHNYVNGIYSIIDDVLKNKTYSNSEINKWSNIICEECMKYLYSKTLPLKYIISCYILKNSNAETSIQYSTYWGKDDRHLQICWPHDQNNCNMLCYINIYALKVSDGSVAQL
ncbi:dynein light chain Tctex-type, putative [Plasmodium vinckei lentum]|uniref:Dynein light chain Tctex-type, putative n=1 Tax=Plasmodium vinckei lentum TaxID=138297 RepID=A0A6V7SJ77_PLAVN|nr:dynein light chain Tctex-type, putative [Plasmodium vinckei lentum]